MSESKSRGGPPTDLSDTIAKIRERLAAMTPEQIAAQELERARDEATQERHRREARLRESGIVPVLRDVMHQAAVDGTLKRTRAIEIVDDWLAHEVPVLGIFGGRGSGKTLGAAHALICRGGMYFEAEELCRLRSARYGDDRKLYERARASGMLVVDELGGEKYVDAAQETLHDIINHRQGSRCRTLLLGNLDRPAFDARYDPRTHDRLKDIANLRAIVAPSMRGQR